jgi:dihydroneopterin aldolase
MDFIRVEGLEVDCIVGLRPHERRRKQRVVLDIELGLDLATAGRSGRIAHTSDYDQMAEEVRKLLEFRRYLLIEAATEELAAMLLGVHRLARTVRIRFVKPGALPGRAASASVEITRTPQDYPRVTRVSDLVTLEVLLETQDAGLYLAHVRPGEELPRLARVDGRQHGWVVAGELWSAELAGAELAATGGRRVGVGDSVALPAPGMPPTGHGYRNASSEAAQVFVCSCPPLSSVHPAGT